MIFPEGFGLVAVQADWLAVDIAIPCFVGLLFSQCCVSLFQYYQRVDTALLFADRIADKQDMTP
jgi:hypothetical protein